MQGKLDTTKVGQDVVKTCIAAHLSPLHRDDCDKRVRRVHWLAVSLSYGQNLHRSTHF